MRFIVPILILPVLLLAACREFPVDPLPGEPRQGDQDITVQPGEPFRFSVNDVAHVDGTPLSVTFRLVAEESRCPSNVDCIHPGRASILLIVTTSVDDAEYQLLASIPGLVESPYLDAPEIVFEGLTFRLTDLSPYPVAGIPVRSFEYVATMSIDVTP